MMNYLKRNAKEILRELGDALKVIPAAVLIFLTLFYLVYTGHQILSDGGNVFIETASIFLYLILIYPLLSLVYRKRKKEYIKVIRGALNSTTLIFLIIVLTVKYTQVLMFLGLEKDSLDTGGLGDTLAFSVVGMSLAAFVYLLGRLLLVGRDVDLLNPDQR